MALKTNADELKHYRCIRTFKNCRCVDITYEILCHVNTAKSHLHTGTGLQSLAVSVSVALCFHCLPLPPPTDSLSPLHPPSFSPCRVPDFGNAFAGRSDKSGSFTNSARRKAPHIFSYSHTTGRESVQEVVR